MMSHSQLIQKFLNTLEPKRTASERLFAVGLIGLPASGKTTIARYLGERLGLYIASNDAVRRFLNREGLEEENPNGPLLRDIAEARTQYLYKNGVSHIIDADLVLFMDRAKKYASEYNAQIYFVHIICPRDIAIRRIHRRQRDLENGIVESDSRADETVFSQRELIHKLHFHSADTFFTIDSSKPTQAQLDGLIFRLTTAQAIFEVR